MSDARKRAGVASRESKGQTKSIDDQDRENLAVCAEQGWEVVDLYRDGVSASRFGTRERRNWNRLVADVADGKLDVVVVWEVSRADRDLETWVAFVAMCRRLMVQVHVTSHESTYDPTNRRQWRALIDEGVDAADESEKISARALKGIRGAVGLGKAHGPAPYGLTRVYDPLDRREFTQRPDEHAPVVREIIARIADNDPIITIERDLNGRGVPPPAWPGIPAPLGLWRRNTIRNIARNPAYAGLRGHNGVHHPGNWDAIVDLETWQAAQVVLGDESRRSSPPGSFRWLLSYIATSPCGAMIHTRPGSGSRATRRDRYHCFEDGCTSIGTWELDECVTRVVLAWFARKGARALFEGADEAAAAARLELAELNAELEAARESYARPRGISETALAMKERALVPLIEQAQGRIMRATAPAAAVRLLTAAEREESLIRPTWEALSIAAQRSVITDLIESITVGPMRKRLTRWSTDDERLQLAGERTTITWIPRAASAQ